ncbi:MAG: phosphonate degradation HD-domain oxygenase [Pseudomonadota bacterium]
MRETAVGLITQIESMIDKKGSDLYGSEAVTQRQHALQCAALAEAENAPASLIAAALLHDIGHLLEKDFEEALINNEDRFHENLGEAFLKTHFGPEVTEPVRMHVDAKRYLCATDPDYFAKLSPASVHSLRIQGGPMDEGEAAAFIAQPYAKDAVRLRVWDDTGKDPEMETEPVDHFMIYVSQCLKD